MSDYYPVHTCTLKTVINLTHPLIFFPKKLLSVHSDIHAFMSILRLPSCICEIFQLKYFINSHFRLEKYPVFVCKIMIQVALFIWMLKYITFIVYPGPWSMKMKKKTKRN